MDLGNSLIHNSNITSLKQGKFFFLTDLFLYLVIDIVFHPSGIFKMAWKFLQNFMFKDGVIAQI